MTAAWNFDPAGFTASITSTCNGTTLDSHSYTRDAVGNITQEGIGGANPSTSTFAYDDLYRLTSATVNGTSYSYVYDQVGNCTSRTAGGVTTPFTFDSADHLTGVGGYAAQTDANGNVLGDNYGGWLYTWDARGRLTSASRGTPYTFTYGPDNLRVSKSVNGVLTTYLLDGDQVVTDTINGTANQTLYGPGTDHALARNGEYFLPNHLSSTTGLTNGSGSLTQSYQYDPFGMLLNAASDSNPFQFTGREQDGDGLLYCRARYYNPFWGRFLSADPAGSGVNPYVYANDNPVNYGDASGLDPNTDPQADYRWVWGGAPPPPGMSTPDPAAPTAPAAGFTGGPDALNTATDFFSGWGDAVSGGLTDAIRQAAGLNHVVNKGSGSYWAGTLTGVVNDLLLPGGEAEGGGKVLTIEPVATCFPAGTPIAIRGGEEPIEKVQVGDEALSADPATGKQSYQRVEKTFTLSATQLLRIETADGRSVEATPVHPLWVKGKGFVAAKSLVKGDRLEDAHGHLVQIVRITSRRGKFVVYNLTVASTHTYYAGGWWVHNVDCTSIAVKLWKNRGDGWVYRLESPGGWLGGPGRWHFHDVFITDDGIVFDPMQGHPNGVDIETWLSTPTTNAPYPDAYTLSPVEPGTINRLLR